MGGFFNGTRRKFAILTLAIALLFMGGWIRSRSYAESGTIRLNENQLLVGISNRGSFRLIMFKLVSKWPSDAELFPIGTVKWKRATVGSSESKFMKDPVEIINSIFINCNDLNLEMETSDWEIPYLPATLFMAFVSSFLLLVNPRSGKPKNEEDGEENGIIPITGFAQSMLDTV